MSNIYTYHAVVHILTGAIRIHIQVDSVLNAIFVVKSFGMKQVTEVTDNCDQDVAFSDDSLS